MALGCLLFQCIQCLRDRYGGLLNFQVSVGGFRQLEPYFAESMATPTHASTSLV